MNMRPFIEQVQRVQQTLSKHLSPKPSQPLSIPWEPVPTEAQLKTYNRPPEEEKPLHNLQQEEFPSWLNSVLVDKKPIESIITPIFDTPPQAVHIAELDTVAETPVVKHDERISSLIRTQGLTQPSKRVTDALMEMAYPAQPTTDKLTLIPKTTMPLPSAKTRQIKHYEGVPQDQYPMMLIKHSIDKFFKVYGLLPEVVYVSTVNKYKMERANYEAYHIGTIRIPIENDLHLDCLLENDEALAVGR